MLLNVYTTNFISPVRTAEHHPLVFPVCQMAFPRQHTMGYHAPKVRRHEMFSAIILSILLKTNFLIRN